MNTRRATVLMTYNGADASEDLKPDTASFSYTDVASGSSDSINVTLTDKFKRWINGWFPQKGDQLIPKIAVQDWSAEGDSQNFSCGTFLLDDFSFSGGPPIQLSIGAVAIPTDSSFKTTKRTKTYEAATLQEIAQEVAGRAGVSLEYEADVINIEKIEQTNQEDITFLNALVEKCGLSLKIYNTKIVIFRISDYEAKGPKATFTPQDMDPGWSYNSTLDGVYTAVKYQYTEGIKGATYTVEAGEGDRILRVNDPEADNLSEAIRNALAAVEKANREAVTFNFTIMAKPGLIATDCVQIDGLGKISGKYFIDKITHSVGDGYKMSFETHLVVPPITNVTTATETYE